jgi:oligoribonuclease
MEEKDNVLVWVDLEMTGLDVKSDEIVEIAVVVTDAFLNVIDDGISIIVKPSKDSLDSMGDFVFNMHKKSVLLPKIHAGVSIEHEEREVLQYLKSLVPASIKPVLAGNTISSDRKFIEKYMPRFDAYLHYRMIDVSSIKELCKRLNPVVFNSRPVKQGDHRALGDIFESIDELTYYKDNFFVVNTDFNYKSETSA